MPFVRYKINKGQFFVKEQKMKNGVEIERKFKLNSLPCVELGKGDRIHQGYLKQLRIRRLNDKHILCLKSGEGITRREWEMEVPAWVAEELFMTCECELEKSRFRIERQGGHPFEIDVYYGEALAGLITLEVEFDTEDEAEEFISPDWMREAGAVEVTGDPRYLNITLARIGRPNPLAK